MYYAAHGPCHTRLQAALLRIRIDQDLRLSASRFLACPIIRV